MFRTRDLRALRQMRCNFLGPNQILAQDHVTSNATSWITLQDYVTSNATPQILLQYKTT